MNLSPESAKELIFSYEKESIFKSVSTFKEVPILKSILKKNP